MSSRARELLRTMPGFVIQLQAASVSMSVACVTQEALGTMQVEVRELNIPFNSLSLGKLAFPLTGYYSKQTGPCTPER